MYGNMKAGYGFNVSEADLREAGAERVFIDTTKDRVMRDDLLALLSPGDEVLVFYVRHLGGSPIADKTWAKRVEAKGATVRVVSLDRKPKVMGRPKRPIWDATKARQCHDAWTGPGTEKTRLQRVADITGHTVGKGLLHGRFGNPGDPKPFSEADYQ